MVVNYAELVDILQKTRGNYGDPERQAALQARMSRIRDNSSAAHNRILEGYAARRAAMADPGFGASGHSADDGHNHGAAQLGTGVGNGGLATDFQEALNRMIRDYGRPGIGLGSGYRSVAEQAKIYNAWKSGRYKVPRVAKPGSSNHNYGLAMDLRFGNTAARQWAHQNAARYGLRFPMADEPWHIEPLNARQRRGR